MTNLIISSIALFFKAFTAVRCSESIISLIFFLKITLLVKTIKVPKVQAQVVKYWKIKLLEIPHKFEKKSI